MHDLMYPKLRGRIIEKYGSLTAFAKIIGLSKTSMSKKMTGKSGFSQSDIVSWCDALDIDLADVGLFFILRKFD